MTLRHRLGRTAAVLAAACAVLAALPATAAHAESIRDMQWHLRALQIDDVHRITTGKGVVVAVLDTGVEPNHPDLRGQVLKGAGFGKGAGSTRDYDGHGTGMAGIIAAKGGGPNHALGIAPGVKILPGRITDEGNASTTAIRDAIRWATDQGAKVINLSFADDERTLQYVHEAVEYALAKDVVIVTGSGNRPKGHEKVGAVGAIPGVVTVGATDRSGNLWSGSVTGPEVALTAPGVEVVTPSSRRAGSKTGYGASTGTSGATAVVSGAAALIRSRYPTMKAPDVINRLLATAQDAGPAGRDEQFGFGRLNIERALTADIPSVSVNPLGDAGASPTAGVATGADDERPNPLTGEAIGGLVIIGAVVLGLPIFLLVVLIMLVRGRRRRLATLGPPVGFPAGPAPGQWPGPPAGHPPVGYPPAQSPPAGYPPPGQPPGQPPGH